MAHLVRWFTMIYLFFWIFLTSTIMKLWWLGFEPHISIAPEPHLLGQMRLSNSFPTETSKWFSGQKMTISKQQECHTPYRTLEKNPDPGSRDPAASFSPATESPRQRLGPREGRFSMAVPSPWVLDGTIVGLPCNFDTSKSNPKSLPIPMRSSKNLFIQKLISWDIIGKFL